MAILGYGKQLRICLAQKKAKKEDLNPDILKKYLGGVGYGAKILFDELNAGIDPLGPENKIVLATGPLTSNRIPGGGSIEVCFKSPLTNGWGESRSGSDFGPDMRKTGYDFVIIEGKSTEPIYLVLTDEKIEFKSAEHLLGKTVKEKTDMIRKTEGDEKLSVMCIGPGGENKVLFATIMCDDRAAGRCGGGAVMGSKNLLGIAVKGNQKVTLADTERVNAAIKEGIKAIRENPDSAEFRKHGTVGDIPTCDSMGDWPTKNWQSNSWGKGEELYNHFFNQNLKQSRGCYTGCPIGCSRVAKVDSGTYKTPEHDGCEYESISAFTAFVLNEDMDCAVYSTYLCNQYGIDTISAGGVIAFALECYENGLITKEDCNGLELKWGNAKVLPELVKKKLL